MAEAKKDPIYQPKTLTVEDYTQAGLHDKVTALLSTKKYKDWVQLGDPTYGGNSKMFYQCITPKTETTPAPPEG